MTATATQSNQAAQQGHLRPVYGRVAAFGLLLIALAPLTMLTLGVLTGMELGEEGPFLGAMVAVPLLAAALAWRFGTWSKVLALVVALLAIGAIFWVAFGLAFPGSFGDFVPGALFVTGEVLALFGSVAALVGKRRGRMTSSTTTGERRWMLGATAVVALAVVTSGAITLLSGGSAGDAAGTRVTMTNFTFAEETYQVAAGQPSTLVVHNSDAFAHDIAIPALGLEKTTVLPGEDAVVQVQPQAGEYTVYCTLHSDPTQTDPEQAGMAARLVAR